MDQCVRGMVAEPAKSHAGATPPIRVDGVPTTLFRELFCVSPESGVHVGDEATVHGGPASDPIAATVTVADATVGQLALAVAGPSAVLLADELRALAATASPSAS